MSVQDQAVRVAAALDALDQHRAFLGLSWQTWRAAQPKGDVVAVFEAWAQEMARVLCVETPALLHCPPRSVWLAMIACAQAGGLDPAVAAALEARVKAAFPDAL